MGKERNLIFWGQFSSVAQSCPTLCDPMNRSTPGLPVHHQLPESTQTRVHWVGDAIQPSRPLSSPSPTALNLSQNQGLFQWVSSSHQMAKVLEFQLRTVVWASINNPGRRTGELLRRENIKKDVTSRTASLSVARDAVKRHISDAST